MQSPNVSLPPVEELKNKIIYIPVKDLPDGDNPYLRENFQRNCIIRGLLNAKDKFKLSGIIISLGFNLNISRSKSFLFIQKNI